MDDGWFSKYIAAHPAELATVRPDYTKDDLLISATTDDLQAFLQRHEKDEGFFGGDTTFVRPGDPATQPALAPAKAP
jgi:hypothetical protein